MIQDNGLHKKEYDNFVLEASVTKTSLSTGSVVPDHRK